MSFIFSMSLSVILVRLILSFKFKFKYKLLDISAFFDIIAIFFLPFDINSLIKGIMSFIESIFCYLTVSPCLITAEASGRFKYLFILFASSIISIVVL